MVLLVTGLALFLGLHLVPTVPALRASLVARFGERGYKGAFSALSAVGLVLVVIGFGVARGDPALFAPVPQAVTIRFSESAKYRGLSLDTRRGPCVRSGT